MWTRGSPTVQSEKYTTGNRTPQTDGANDQGHIVRWRYGCPSLDTCIRAHRRWTEATIPVN